MVAWGSSGPVTTDDRRGRSGARRQLTLGQPFSKDARVDLERVGETHDARQGRVHLTALDVPDVGAVEAGELAELLLGDPKVLAMVSHSVAECDLDSIGHASSIPICTLCIDSIQIAFRATAREG